MTKEELINKLTKEELEIILSLTPIDFQIELVKRNLPKIKEGTCITWKSSNLQYFYRITAMTIDSMKGHLIVAGSNFIKEEKNHSYLICSFYKNKNDVKTIENKMFEEILRLIWQCRDAKLDCEKHFAKLILDKTNNL